MIFWKARSLITQVNSSLVNVFACLEIFLSFESNFATHSANWFCELVEIYYISKWLPGVISGQEALYFCIILILYLYHPSVGLLKRIIGAVLPRSDELFIALGLWHCFIALPPLWYWRTRDGKTNLHSEVTTEVTTIRLSLFVSGNRI